MMHVMQGKYGHFKDVLFLYFTVKTLFIVKIMLNMQNVSSSNKRQILEYMPGILKISWNVSQKFGMIQVSGTT